MLPREYLPTRRQDDSSTKGVFRYIVLYHTVQNISHDSHIKLERNIWYTIMVYLVYYIIPFGLSYEDYNLISWSPEENSAHLADIATHLKGMQVFKVLGEVLKRQCPLDQRGRECAIWVGMYVNKFETYSWYSSLLRWYLEWSNQIIFDTREKVRRFEGPRWIYYFSAYFPLAQLQPL